MPTAELALRWARQREVLTSALVGCSTLSQLEQDYACFGGGGGGARGAADDAPLPAELMWEIDRVHMENRLPIFSSEHAGRSGRPPGEGDIGERIP